MTKFIAHRGASYLAPENTLSAFKLAKKNEVDFVEFDVRLSKDGIPVVIHDPVIKEAIEAGRVAEISKLTLEEIKQWDVGTSFGSAYAGERIPTLREVFDLGWQNTGLMLEIKECGSEDLTLVSAIFDILLDLQHLPKLIIGSFSPEIVLESQKLIKANQLDISLIGIVEEMKYIERFIEMRVGYMAVWEKLVTSQLVHDLHSSGIEVWVFTVDEISRAQSLIALEVDGIISNKLDAGPPML